MTVAGRLLGIGELLRGTFTGGNYPSRGRRRYRCCCCWEGGERKPVNGNFRVFLYHKNKKKKKENNNNNTRRKIGTAWNRNIFTFFFFFFISFVKGNRENKEKRKLKINFFFIILIIEKFLSEGGLWAAWWCEFVYIYSPVSTWFPPYLWLLHILS